MPVSIVSNSASLIAQNSLRASNTRMGETMSKLSSGERVFSAAEDAAALGVGAGMKVEVAALRSAMLNTSTASSLLQVAEGALAQVTDILQRMKTLASQASSGQYSDVERNMVDAEFTKLRDEIDRIAADTSFGGQDLLSGDALYDVDYGHSIQADGISSPEFNSAVVTSDATFRYTYDSNTEELTMTRIDGGAAQTQTIDITALLDVTAGVGQNLTAGEEVLVQFSGPGVSITLDDAFDRTSDIMGTVTDNSGADIAFTFPAPVAPAVISEPVTFATTSVTDETVDALIALDASATEYSLASGMLTVDVQTDGAAVTLGGVAGVRYAVNGGAVGADGADSADLVSAPGYFDVYLTTASGTENILRVSFDSLTTSGTTDGTMDIPLGRGMFDADYTASGGDLSLEFMVGTSATANEDLLTVTLSPTTASVLGLTTLSVGTMTGAETTMGAIDTAIVTVNTMRAEIGANQSRLEFVALKLGTDIENTENARSALLDADIPDEIANLATDQALVEMGLAMLTRVNQQPERILQLLEG
ncbi:MAG: flagellin [Alphaproteobacteria bacterium]|nr:flagellin [Alphaproteobacteria bacterium]MDD9919332.1 flagellin [Alphaproteobacteria bacterium]